MRYPKLVEVGVAETADDQEAAGGAEGAAAQTRVPEDKPAAEVDQLEERHQAAAIQFNLNKDQNFEQSTLQLSVEQ